MTELRRAMSFFLGDVLWRYGTSAVRPLIALLVLAGIWSICTVLIPLWSSDSGLVLSGSGGPERWNGLSRQSLLSVLNSMYFFIVAPTGAAQGSFAGWAKAAFLVYMVAGAGLLALFIEASMRRTGAGVE